MRWWDDVRRRARLPRTWREARPLLLAGLALAGALGIAAVSLRSPTPPQPESRPPLDSARNTDRDARLDRYVALGDSFAAGPGVAGRPGATSFPYARACERSTANYPQLVAERLDLTLDDRTCSGAAPLELEVGQETQSGVRVPPQLGALSRKTDLVTISIGGNELGLATGIVDLCRRAATMAPEASSPCSDRFGSAGLKRVAAGARSAESAVIRVLEEVDRRAPRAAVLLVGYVNYFAAREACPERTGLAAGDFGYVRSASALLVGAVRRAAERTGMEYVDPIDAFADHLLCSDQPYVAGATGDAGAFHPNADGQAALAELVTRRVRALTD